MPRGRAARMACLVALVCALVAPQPASSATTQTLRTVLFLKTHQTCDPALPYNGCTFYREGPSQGPDLQGMKYHSAQRPWCSGGCSDWSIEAKDGPDRLWGYWHGASFDYSGRLRHDYFDITGGFGAFAGATGTGTLDCVLLKKDLRPLIRHQNYCLLTLEVTLY